MCEQKLEGEHLEYYISWTKSGDHFYCQSNKGASVRFKHIGTGIIETYISTTNATLELKPEGNGCLKTIHGGGQNGYWWRDPDISCNYIKITPVHQFKQIENEALEFCKNGGVLGKNSM